MVCERLDQRRLGRGKGVHRCPSILSEGCAYGPSDLWTVQSPGRVSPASPGPAACASPPAALRDLWHPPALRRTCVRIVRRRRERGRGAPGGSKPPPRRGSRVSPFAPQRREASSSAARLRLASSPRVARPVLRRG